MKLRVSDPMDVHYVRENYFTLEELCCRAGLPRASYVLDDGTHYLIEHIARAIREPHTDDQKWCANLREAVDELDSLERPFTRFDREAFGRTVSRDTYISEVRQSFPQALR